MGVYDKLLEIKNETNKEKKTKLWKEAMKDPSIKLILLTAVKMTQSPLFESFAETAAKYSSTHRVSVSDVPTTLFGACSLIQQTGITEDNAGLISLFIVRSKVGAPLLSDIFTGNADYLVPCKDFLDIDGTKEVKTAVAQVKTETKTTRKKKNKVCLP